MGGISAGASGGVGAGRRPGVAGGPRPATEASGASRRAALRCPHLARASVAESARRE